MKKILIFKGGPGEGGSTFSSKNLHDVLSASLYRFGFKVSFISARDLREGPTLAPNEVEILVLGGGRFTEVKRAIGERGIENIENYVYEGGKYLGVCMGSYAAFPDIEFEGKDIRRGNGLKFFNATARGSLSIASPYDATGNSATIINVHHMRNKIQFPALYWGGNGMDEQELLTIGAQPLSKITLPKGPEKVMSASIDVGINGGKAFACAYHLEAYQWTVIWNWLKGLPGESECYTRLYHEMMQHPDKAYMMASALLLDDINLVPEHSFAAQIYPEMRDQTSMRYESQPFHHGRLVIF
ncbi:MAG: BPL-N domain-containing protein [Pseudomonadota bacterium]